MKAVAFILSLFLAAFLVWALTGCSSMKGHDGTAADAGSTAIALSQGLSEANPIALAALPARIALVEYAKGLPKEQGQPIIDVSRSVGWGAAGYNLAFLAFPPLAPFIGLITGFAVWENGSREREFWTICASEKQRDPRITTCTYSPVTDI